LKPIRDVADRKRIVVNTGRREHLRLNGKKPQVDSKALDVLMSHSWPGNVRELENVIERAIVLCRRETITVEMLPTSLRSERPSGITPFEAGGLPSLAAATSSFEKSYVERVIGAASGNLAEAARLASMDPSNFRRLLKRLQEEA
jgi:DNA-binding NtrC family response regulator